MRIMTICRYEGEIDGFIDGSKAATKGKLNTIHNLHCVEISINGIKAFSESFCNITSRFEHEGFEFDKITTCRLISRLSKVPNLAQDENPWKLLTLEPIYLRDSFVPATPIPVDKTPVFRGLERFPKAYCHGAWLLASIGIVSRDDLPSENQEDVVREIFDKNRKWLAHSN